MRKSKFFLCPKLVTTNSTPFFLVRNKHFIFSNKSSLRDFHSILCRPYKSIFKLDTRLLCTLLLYSAYKIVHYFGIPFE